MKRENYLRAFWGLLRVNNARYGGYIVHIAIILIAIGIVGSSFYDVEKEASLMPGETMTINNYTLTYKKMDRYETQSKLVVRTTLEIHNEGHLIGSLIPEKYFHRSYEQPVTEVAIRSSALEDLYIILVDWGDDGKTSFKALVNPLVSWMWVGGGLLALGGLVAFWPERRKPANGGKPKGKG